MFIDGDGYVEQELSVRSIYHAPPHLFYSAQAIPGLHLRRCIGFGAYHLTCFYTSPLVRFHLLFHSPPARCTPNSHLFAISFLSGPARLTIQLCNVATPRFPATHVSIDFRTYAITSSCMSPPFALPLRPRQERHGSSDKQQLILKYLMAGEIASIRKQPTTSNYERRPEKQYGCGAGTRWRRVRRADYPFPEGHVSRIYRARATEHPHRYPGLRPITTLAGISDRPFVYPTAGGNLTCLLSRIHHLHLLFTHLSSTHLFENFASLQSCIQRIRRKKKNRLQQEGRSAGGRATVAGAAAITICPHTGVVEKENIDVIKDTDRLNRRNRGHSHPQPQHTWAMCYCYCSKGIWYKPNSVHLCTGVGLFSILPHLR